MRFTIKRVLAAAGVMATTLLLMTTPAQAYSMQYKHCEVWIDSIFGGGTCKSSTVPANPDHWVRAGVEYSPGASFRIRDTETGDVVCGEHTAFDNHARASCFGLYGGHYRIEVVGARIGTVGFVANY